MSGRELFAMFIGIGGFVLIGTFGDWLVALGVFLVLWGNNIDHSRRG